MYLPQVGAQYAQVVGVVNPASVDGVLHEAVDGLPVHDCIPPLTHAHRLEVVVVVVDDQIQTDVKNIQLEDKGFTIVSASVLTSSI